jgi:hypothetical protein
VLFFTALRVPCDLGGEKAICLFTPDDYTSAPKKRNPIQFIGFYTQTADEQVQKEVAGDHAE